MDIEAHFEKVKLEDGDVLVITSPHALTYDHAVTIKQAASRVISNLGVHAEVIVLDQGLQAALLKTSQLPKVEEPLTDVQRSVRDGTFGVKSADLTTRRPLHDGHAQHHRGVGQSLEIGSATDAP